MPADTYLKDLQKRLSILNEEEVASITKVYQDYMNQKLAEGYSLEEAQQMLGDVNDLARTILESYKISDRYIRLFVGKEKVIDDLNDYVNKVADSTIEVLSKLESSVKSLFKKTVDFSETQFQKVKDLFSKDAQDEEE